MLQYSITPRTDIMDEQKPEKKIYHPPHLYLDDTIYFVTTCTYGKKPVFDTDVKRHHLLNRIRDSLTEYQYTLYAWVILNDHYHIEFKSREGCHLSKIMQEIHGRCAFEINKMDNHHGRKIFQNYWDRCIRNKRDFYMHFNYIHQNLVKHGYVHRMKDYPFSSYTHWCDKKDEEWLLSCFREYPIVDFTVNQD